MQVLLRREIDHLGAAGDLVTVRPGYARNYLLPQGLALAVSPENARLIEAERETLVQAEQVRVKALADVAQKLADVSVTIADKASPEGHLYGSVNAARIADALQALGFEVDAKMVDLDEPIKELNVYDVPVRLHSGVEASVKVWVVSDAADAAAPAQGGEPKPEDEDTGEAEGESEE